MPPAPAIVQHENARPLSSAAVYEQSDSGGSILQTGGFLDKPTEAVKQGVGKISDAITPTTPVTPAEDPTLLSTKSKPTPELHLSVARYQEEQGKPALADQSYQHALRLSPKHLGAHLAYARFKIRQGQMQEAMQLYQRAAKYHPAEACIHNDIGLLLERQGMNAESLKAFSRAIELQPKRALYRNNAAALLVDLGQPDQAMKHLTAVYGEADACYKLGYLLQKKGQIHQAVAAFSKALALNPSSSDARLWLDHLQSSFPGEPQVARRPSDPTAITELRPAGERPSGVVPGDNPPAARAPVPEPAKGSRGTVRQLPPVVKPLPSSSDGSEANSPSASGLRRLPQTSAERPISYQENIEDADRDVHWVDDRPPAPPDAPLPPPTMIPLPGTARRS